MKLYLIYLNKKAFSNFTNNQIHIRKRMYNVAIYFLIKFMNSKKLFQVLLESFMAK